MGHSSKLCCLYFIKSDRDSVFGVVDNVSQRFVHSRLLSGYPLNLRPFDLVITRLQIGNGMLYCVDTEGLSCSSLICSGLVLLLGSLYISHLRL